ncbi:cbb3-type cytochrome c oxidase subunit I [Alteribacillus sp. YIM 98480]|uniref:cbb3-type cytochrome c oxidase subunit I n=1 Tax=Alteribacillus sp. YIM 98480 TaxID=2606599 RepID=UPI0018EEFC28|nr:cbb3-type cytochrome c oxidase subunit I [Alteribacillus sp. YIM 98480]
MTSRFLKIAVVYFVIGICMGLYMGIVQQFQYTTVHAHINLLGWVSMSLFGIIYYIYPTASQTKLASIHFWLHNLGLPIMQGTLFVMILTNNHSLVLFTIIGSIMVVVGAVLFMINLFSHSANQASSSHP